MAERIPETLQKKLSERLSFYEDLGIRLLYRDRGAGVAPDIERRLETPAVAHLATTDLQREMTLPTPVGKEALRKISPVRPPVTRYVVALPEIAARLIFDVVD